MLVVVCGLPGVGKTTVAEHASERLDGTLLRTDVVRKELFPDPEYTDAEAAAVYDELFARASEELARGGAVVLDGTFHTEDHRERALSVADETDVECRVLRVRGPQDTVEDRIAERETDASDADVRVHRLYRDRFEPVECDHETVDNAGDLEETYAQVDAALSLDATV
jgi:hypothetical protein